MNFDPYSISYGRWSFDVKRRLLYVDGEVVRLQRGVLKLLQYLVRREGDVVTKDELVEAVWDGREVSDAAIYNRVNALRKALADDKSPEHCIQWEYGRGLRFFRHIGSRMESNFVGPETTPFPTHQNLPVASDKKEYDEPKERFIGASPLKDWRYILGIYNTFYRTPSWPNAIKVGVTVLREVDGQVAVWTSERGEDRKVGTRQRARYLGSAIFINGRMYVTEQNSERPHSVCLSTLDAPHKYRPDIMTGLMHGSSWRLGGAPYATRVVWRRVPPGMHLRGALEMSGPYPDDTDLIEPTILTSVGSDCLTFHEQTSAL
ncbi:winged helix-turn-helix domain-containing protein [Ruegeria halocynthiae]|uniref:winged helix-turn-helix domain-containing protein n=1 Tax=Ruegeria halocynthiae TaxID=985054 RepID=UPI00055EE01A|nr:winged helix-turn-helix domain-containing protein [Ruegeria halocynthiae]